MVVEKHQERIINDKKRKFRRPYQKSLNGVQKGKDKGQNNGSLNDSNSISNSKNEGYTVKDVAIVDNSINDLSDNLNSKKDTTSSFEVGQNNGTKQNYNNKDNINANNSVNNRNQTNNNNTINSDNNRNRGRNSQNRNKNDKSYQLSSSSHTRQANNKVQHNNKQAYTQYVNNSNNNYNNNNNNNSGNSYYNHNHSHNYHRSNSNSGNINNNNINQSHYYIRNDRFSQDKRGNNSKMYYYQPNSKKYYYNNNNADYRKQVNNTNNNTAGSTATQTQNRQQNYKNAQYYNGSQFKNSRTQDQQSTASTKNVGVEKNVSSIPCTKETVIDDRKNSSCDIETVNINSDNSCDVLNDNGINSGAGLDRDLGVGNAGNQTRRDSNSQAVGGSKYKNNNANTGGKVNKVIYNSNKNKDDYRTFVGKEHSSNKPLNIARNECEVKTPDSNEDRKPKQQLNNSEQKVKNKRDNNGGFNYRGSDNNSAQYYNNYYYYNSNRNFGSGNNTNNSWKGANQSYHKQNYRYNNVKSYNKYSNNGYYNSNNNNYGSNAIYSKQVNNSNSVNKYQGEFESSYSVESNRSYNNPASYDDYKNKKNKRRYKSGGRDNSIISNNSTNNGGGNNYDLTNECKDLKDEINESKKDDTNGDNDVTSEANDDIGNSGDNFALNDRLKNEEDKGVSVVDENGSKEDTVDNKSCIGLFDKKESNTDASLGSTVNKATLSTVAQNKDESYVSGAIDEGKDGIDSGPKNTTSLDYNGNNANSNCNEGNDNGAGCGYVSGSRNQTLGSGIGLWRRTNQGNQVVDSLETVRRTVKSLLNKITVEKFPVIAEKLAVCIDNISNVDELEELVKQVLDKAITEPDFSEMYADLCQILKWRSPILIKENSVTMGFGKALLLKCEHEFKNLPRNMTPTDEEREVYDSEEIEIICRKRKLHVLGIIRLIGELFIRRMFPMRSLNELVFDLVMTQEKPDEYAIECLCQLIMTTGYYLDSNEKSQMIVDQWFGRLKELQRTHISARLNCLIQDVFDLRKHKWVKKVHKQKAKALADIMKDIDVEDVLGGAAIAAQYGSVVVVGERSNLVGNSAYNSYMTSQEELYISKQKNQQR